MDLSIIIVNWKSADFLRACLRSIFSTTMDLQFEVIVIDNASFDGSEAMVRSEYPAVAFIQSEKNLGFAGANNVGFAYSGGRNVLFLNPDTEIRGRALEVMCHTLDSTPDAGIVGCRLLNSDLSVQNSCIQAFPSILNETLDFDFLRKLFPGWSLWGMRPLLATASGPATVDVVSGACLMIRRTTFEQVDQFSTNYFMYAEDTDLCAKVVQTGWRNYFAGNATVVHHGGCSASSRPNFFAAVMMRESKLTFMRTHRGAAYAFCYRCAATLIAALRILVLLVALPFSNVTGSLGKWIKIFRWSVGLERWAGTFEPGRRKPPSRPQTYET